MSAHNDTAFLRMFLMILGALVAFTFIILIAANWVIGSVEEARGEDPRRLAEVAKRIAPVGSVNVVEADAAPAAPKSGAEIVAAACNACHATGVLESPKIGDKAAWEQRLAAAGGLDGLTASAIKGKGGMPPKGGAMVSDAEIRAAIEDMLSNSGVDAGAAAAAAPAATGPVEAAQEMASDAVDTAKAMVAAVMPTAAPEPAPPAPVAAPEPAAAQAGQALAQAKGCMACHQVAIRVVGPAYKDVAARYKGQADAAAKLAAKVKSGGAGTWGPIPMPPQPTLTDDEVNALVAWVLAQ